MKIKLLTIFLALALGLLSGYFIANISDDDDQTGNSEDGQSKVVPNESPGTAVKNEADRLDNVTNDGDGESGGDSDDQPDTDNQNPTNDVEIISAEQDSNGNVVVKTAVYATSTGTCTLTLEKGQSTVTKTANVVFSPEYSICSGFSVDKSELSNGTWQAKLSVKTGTNTYETPQQEVNVQ